MKKINYLKTRVGGSAIYSKRQKPINRRGKCSFEERNGKMINKMKGFFFFLVSEVITFKKENAISVWLL